MLRDCTSWQAERAKKAQAPIASVTGGKALAELCSSDVNACIPEILGTKQIKILVLSKGNRLSYLSTNRTSTIRVRCAKRECDTAHTLVALAGPPRAQIIC